jgi:rhodanese-related sulfurtransferase
MTMPVSLPPQELAARLRAGEQVYLLDVRQPPEHEYAALPNSHLVPLDELPQRWQEIRPAPGAALVAYCHHGVRSWHAAQVLESAGLGPVFSLSGGLDAWSRDVDPTVPRY